AAVPSASLIPLDFDFIRGN
ncbi:hypothetical protein A2U01_0111543, partial [Trifolium medium]|nr:hypothetical protein [Trifolium medium]